MNIDQPVRQTPHKITKVTAKRRLKFFSFSIVLSLFSLLYIRPSLLDGQFLLQGLECKKRAKHAKSRFFKDLAIRKLDRAGDL